MCGIWLPVSWLVPTKGGKGSDTACQCGFTGRKKIKTVLPLWFAKGTAPLAETYYKILRQPPLYTRYSLYTLTGNGRFSHEKADRELGYTTRDMQETLRDTAAFLVAQGRIRHPGRLSANLR